MADLGLLDKLRAIKQRFDEVADLIIQPDIVTDQARYAKLNKEYSDLKDFVEKQKEYENLINVIDEADEIIADGSDAEMVELAKIEKDEAINAIPVIEEEIKMMLIPKDPEDDKNVVVELRSGTGGDEAAIFVEDIYRMYSMYFKEKGWKHEVLNLSEASVKGYKELVMQVEGNAVYGTLKYESGVHRVQRVPETESQGRVHTSACTVAILPEVDVDTSVEINSSELRIDTYRASGAGGQHINKTDSAVRITHLPTGTVVECQDERSQHKNKAKAMALLVSRLENAKRAAVDAATSEMRRDLVGSGDRSERIRTYNYPQGRMTDHRINLTLYKLDAVMEGDLTELLDSLHREYQADQLAMLAQQNGG